MAFFMPRFPQEKKTSSLGPTAQHQALLVHMMLMLSVTLLATAQHQTLLVHMMLTLSVILFGSARINATAPNFASTRQALPALRFAVSEPNASPLLRVGQPSIQQAFLHDGKKH